MKLITAFFLGAAMLLSIPFVSEALLSGESSVMAAQVVRKTKRTSKYVGRRTWNGTKWVYTKTRVKTHSPRRKTWRTGRKVVSRTKKVLF